MCYLDDLEQELESEIVHFAVLTKSLIDANVFHVTQTFETDIFLQLSENDLNDAFPNVIIMLKIYLCMFVVNCEGERSRVSTQFPTKFPEISRFSRVNFNKIPKVFYIQSLIS